MRTLLLSLCLMLFAGQAVAHTRSESFSDWTIDPVDQGYTVGGTFTITEREATRVPFDHADGRTTGQRLLEYLTPQIGFLTDTGKCNRTGMKLLPAREGFVRIGFDFACDGAELSMRMTSILELMPSHIHFARIKTGEGTRQEYLFTAQSIEALLLSSEGEAQAQDSGFLDYLYLGVEHIITGYDHLAFVLAIMMLAGTFRNAAIAVTGFTIGHSLTLALAVLGIAKPNGQVVEALIGFTIALAAIEFAVEKSGKLIPALLVVLVLLLVPLFVSDFQMVVVGLGLFSICYLALTKRVADPGRYLRPGVTATFGLIHGFGFAGLLLELGLPTGRTIEALLGFNIGVEIGQIAFVIVIGALVTLVLKARLIGAFAQNVARDSVTAGLAGLGIFWFIDRLI